MEGTQLLDFCLQLLNPAHHGHHWSLMQPRCQLIQPGWRSDGISLHAAIIQIPDPACQAQISRFALYECAKPNALHTP
jgi:hypothetical protein